MPEDVLEIIEWQEDVPTKEWCLNNICLTQEASPSMPGWISFRRTPWIPEILDDWDLAHVKEYNIMASTQVAKTTIQFCCVAKELDTNPGQMQFTIPTDDGVSDYVSTKFDPFIIDSIERIKKKVLQRKDDEKKRLKGALKEVPNGKVFILGNTEKNRRSKSVTKVFIDEAALFGSGHIDEIIGRMKFSETTESTKAMIVSSIKREGDEIQVQFENSYCKKELQIKCEGCLNHFYPTSRHFKYMQLKDYKEKYNLESVDNINDYKREAKKTARVECECGHAIYEDDIGRLVKQGKVTLKIVEGSADDDIYGYKLNALATGLTKYSTIAELMIKSWGDEDKLATIYPDYFNEIWQPDTVGASCEDILSLENEYEEFEIPDETIGLYMGVDSQKGYYWVTIVAIAYQLKTHLVWAGRVEDLSTIEGFMDREWRYKDGTIYYQGIRRAYHDYQGYKTPEKEIVTNNDTGEVVEELYLDMPQEVKEFASKMAEKYGADSEGRERYYAVRGEEFLTNDEVFKMSSTSFELKSYSEKRKIKTLRINTTSTKTTFMRMVMNNIKKIKATEDDDAFFLEERLFYINSTEINRLKNREKVFNTDFDKQITAETWARGSKGYMIWDNPKKLDNHYFDCISYIMTSIQMDSLYSVPRPEKPKNQEESIKEAASIVANLGI